MTRQRKMGRQDLIVKGKKTYVKYQDTENSNSDSWSTSALCSFSNYKDKTQLKMSSTNSLSGISSFQSKPLRQINGNEKVMSTMILSNSNSQEMLNESEVTFFRSSDEFCGKSDMGYCSPNIQQERAKQPNRLNSVSMKSLKRFKNNCKSAFSSRSINSENYSKQILNCFEPFNNQCDVKKAKKNDPAGAKTNGLNSASKSSLADENRPISTKSMDSCQVSIERIDAKICFMGYLGLRLIVKTNATIMHELSLLRKHNIRKCKVLISKLPIKPGGKLKSYPLL